MATAWSAVAARALAISVILAEEAFEVAATACGVKDSTVVRLECGTPSVDSNTGRLNIDSSYGVWNGGRSGGCSDHDVLWSSFRQLNQIVVSIVNGLVNVGVDTSTLILLGSEGSGRTIGLL